MKVNMRKFIDSGKELSDLFYRSRRGAFFDTMPLPDPHDPRHAQYFGEMTVGQNWLGFGGETRDRRH